MNPKPVVILLAEDDADDRMIFREANAMIPRPSILQETFDGESVLKLLGETVVLPDVLVMDINMGGINGIECLRLIRADKRFVQLPVIMMSTANQYQTILEAKNSGANYYVIKPASFEILQAIITYITDIDWNRHVPNSEEFLLNNIV